ncbi:MAG: Sigma70-r4-2 domain-containing protein [Thermocaproicibacter melissae]|jgi:RNA polymerase sigma factor (sigma-70 family)|uniref:RNA polymerase sigma factor n=1 Tax=Thermocaproicibacter melissae TaxID=2966552 RepID=UPI0024B250EF|nr:sigma-70 family RNA polymerase sigma factor [Thermocaproicibacter melissae]WBY63576.1 sigma-70 family RNA polymerase sigma factor [Thermocaproicibacter melissae]
MKNGRILSLDLLENYIAANEREEEDVRRKLLLRALKGAVNKELTPRQRECVELLYGKGMSQRQIAAQLGLSPATVSRHLAKARRRLLRVLQYYV